MVDLGLNRPVQLAVLGVLWREGALPLWRIERSVHREYKYLAQSTVSTTLTRLINHGWIERCDRHYYKPVITRQEMIAALTAAIEDA